MKINKTFGCPFVQKSIIPFPWALGLLLILFSGPSWGQVRGYRYQRELLEVNSTWHALALPNDLFGKISPGLSDLRIIGILGTDTVEVPYIVKIDVDKEEVNSTPFTILNKSRNPQGFFYTFEVPTANPINQIDLDIDQDNFDWRLSLEGSHDQSNWFSLAENQRVLSIKNDQANYRYTRLVFPDAAYRFFRIGFNSKTDPGLIQATLSEKRSMKGKLTDYSVKSFSVLENKKEKETLIDMELDLPVPVDFIKINIKDTLDYFRPVTLQYLSDSFKTQKGWHYNYSTLMHGNLSSLEENIFSVDRTLIKKMRILVHNHDNVPLQIISCEIKGYAHELIARFPGSGNYLLVYGNPKANHPVYDLANFENSIPPLPPSITLGPEIVVETNTLVQTHSLFKNSYWLWGSMALIILLLGGFSISMIRKKQ